MNLTMNPPAIQEHYEFPIWRAAGKHEKAGSFQDSVLTVSVSCDIISVQIYTALRCRHLEATLNPPARCRPARRDYSRCKTLAT